jgi:hypothetical protein
MQKWEYTQIQVKYLASGLVEIILRDGIQDYKTKMEGMYLYFYLNKLGRDGWELVSTVNNEIFYLKRPIE